MHLKSLVILLCLSRCTISGQLSNIQTTFEDYLTTKTPYRLVANTTDERIQYEGCKPLKIWSLIRHGTRHPNIKLIRRMQERLPVIRDLIIEHALHSADYANNNSNLDSFKNWTVQTEAEHAKALHHVGEDELVDLAERMQRRFPELLDDIYSSSSYYFRFTKTRRTKRSAESFAVGLFGRRIAKDVVYPEPVKRDPILRFYKLCDKWRTDIRKNPRTLAEKFAFDDSRIMKETISDVNERLNLNNNALNFDDIYMMYATCAFETAWNNRLHQSPWCSVFSIDNLEALQYSEDLKYYWIDGYGFQLTHEQACPAFKDMFDFLTKLDKDPLKAMFYFTHSGTLLKMLAHLGLYRDKNPLIANDFHANSGRKWRVNKIGAFGTNVAFILFDCDGRRRRLLTMHQENVVRLPCCPDSDLCDVDDVGNYYKKSIEQCSFHRMCEN